MALPVQYINEKFQGVIRFRGREIGVSGALPGDLVQFETLRNGRHFNIKVVKIEKTEEKPADLTLAEPFCPNFPRCGGCSGQHLSYKDQLRIKAGPVAQRMLDHFGIQSEIVPAPATSSHRNRMDFAVDDAVIGLRPAGDFSSFVDIENCAVQTDAANTLLRLFRQALQKYPEAAFRRSDSTGSVKYLTLRPGPESAVILTLHPESRSPAYTNFIDYFIDLLNTFDPGISIVETYSQGEVSAPAGGQALKGSGNFKEQLGGLEFQLPYDSFFQPNPAAFDLLLDSCTPWIGSLRERAPVRLFDFFCGAGILSAIITSRFPGLFTEVRGYEFTESCVPAAKNNLRHFPGKAEFEQADLNKPSPDLLKNVSENDLIVLDPPRAGIGAPLRKLLRSAKAQSILYISCNPKTQIPDLQELKDFYDVKFARIVDCYPQTGHLEQAVWLEKKEN